MGGLMNRIGGRLGAGVGLTVGLAVLAGGATAQAPSPPVNDAYLASLHLNRPGTKLDHVHTLRDPPVTTAATVQSDIFNPPSHGGPPEFAGCGEVSEGKTIWYDFYPDADGLVRIRTSGFDTVMAVMPYDTKTLLPDNGQRQCAVSMTTNSKELFYKVKAGRAYTIQIGGGNGEGRMLEFLFDYVIPPGPPLAHATPAAPPP